MKPKNKSITHKELAELGAITVKVKSEVLPSKFIGRPPYVLIELNSEDRFYYVENKACEDFWLNTTGQQFVVQATGEGKMARIDLVATQAPEPEETTTKPAPKSKSKKKAATKEAVPDAVDESDKSAAEQSANRIEAGHKIDRLGNKIGNLLVHACRATLYAEAQVKEATGWQWNETLREKMAMNIAIQMEKEGMLRFVPTGLPVLPAKK